MIGMLLPEAVTSSESGREVRIRTNKNVRAFWQSRRNV